MTDTYWIVIGITGALWFVYLLADKWSRNLARREQDDLDTYESFFEDDERR